MPTTQRTVAAFGLTEIQSAIQLKASAAWQGTAAQEHKFISDACGRAGDEFIELYSAVSFFP